MHHKQITLDVQVQNNRFYLKLPIPCTDITLHWKHAWDLGDLIGRNAFLMKPQPSDYAQDCALADADVRVGRHDQENIVLYFPRKVHEFNWNRGTALEVAEKICDECEKLVESLAKAGKYKVK